MGDERHPAFRRPVARLLVVVLGLLGFVAGPVGAGVPAGAGAPGRAPSTGTVSGVRAGVVQQAPSRTRLSGKQRAAGRTQTAIAAAALHAAGAAAPSAQPEHATLPASGAATEPRSGRLVRAAAAHVPPDVAPRGAPRGRAPPASTGI
ncbi:MULTISPECIES: hypothetical protein [unclassified Actinomadura]|uniref:hypothetical protein n=1 Tax=unclassified Actinomadura TaxID=2626254 RepID=UPI0011EE38CC|nr:hypothetical protein [Actinomadura sp. K4S16]